jgi:hypothetical protein
MASLFIDQDFNQRILRGLRRRIPELDSITAYEAGLSEAPDPKLLAHAAAGKRIMITHDRQTMPTHAAERMAAGEPMPGLIVVPRRLPINQVIDDLEIIVMCSREDEWKNIVSYLPL